MTETIMEWQEEETDVIPFPQHRVDCLMCSKVELGTVNWRHKSYQPQIIHSHLKIIKILPSRYLFIISVGGQQLLQWEVDIPYVLIFKVTPRRLVLILRNVGANSREASHNQVLTFQSADDAEGVFEFLQAMDAPLELLQILEPGLDIVQP